VTNIRFLRVLACLSIAGLAGCAVVQDTIISSMLGFPASHAVRDIHATSREYGEEQHKKRVEELSRDYEAFVRSRKACDVNSTNRMSIVTVDQTDVPDSACIANNEILRIE
jgi:hypothetical protein